MHGSDNHGGGDHSYGHAGGNYHFNQAAGHGPGHNNHFAGGGDHGGAGMSAHGLSIAHAGDFFGHSGSIAVEGMVFMAFLGWAGSHHGSDFHYSLGGNNVHVGYDHADHIDGTGLGGYGIRRSGGANRLKPIAVSDTKVQPDSRIFIVHAHNIGDPDLPLLIKLWPEKLGLVDITDTPNMGGVNEEKKKTCFSWDWAKPYDGPLPPGALPGVTVDSIRFKRIYQLGKVNPNLGLFRKIQLWSGLGAPAHRGELVPDINSNVTVEVYGLQWVYGQTGTAEVKLEIRVKPNLRYYPSSSRVPGRWAIVEKPFEANRAAALALAKRLHHELSEFNRVPGKLEAYLDKLSKLPGGYFPAPTNIPDGVTPGTTEDERELEDLELERARNEDRNSDGQLPTTTLPTTPATPVTPAPTVDGLPSTPDQDTGSAVDGLPGYTEYAPAAPAPTAPSAVLPSAPGSVTAALGLPAAAPMPETQMGNQLEGRPTKTVDGDGTVEVHVPLGDFPDYHGHHI
ncbi:MAG: hypothetical protein P4L53_06565 [Candidatus Obscuribacterales bacterium]|nr:hypothetical protein [Candidatus Obscuribacterales bacterium]